MQQAEKEWIQDRIATNTMLKKVIASYESNGFMAFAREYKALTELPDRFVFSIKGLGVAIGHLSDSQRGTIEQAYKELRELAKQRRIAWIARGGMRIELAKPVI